MGGARGTPAERFWAKVQVGDDCWEWTASFGSHGYGSFWPGKDADGKNLPMVTAPRYAYELLVGAVPEGLQIDHLCRNRRCVRPAHLEVVTPGENVRRGLAGSLVTHCPQGHEYTPANTARQANRSGGMSRVCRQCHRERQRAYQARTKES